MAEYTEKELDAIFAQGVLVLNCPPSLWRQDGAGAWIRRDAYGDTRPCGYGWTVAPSPCGGGRPRPLQWENARAKALGSKFAKVTSHGDKNIYCEIPCDSEGCA